MTVDWLTVAGRRVRYRVDGTGAPVVLLHGIGRSLDDWTDQHRLLRDRFRVYSLDLPGYGHSAPLPVPHTLPALAESVAAFCDRAGITTPAHLAGNSLGGAVAMQLAVHDPARVASLVLVNSAGFGATVTRALRVLAVRPLGRLLLRPSRFTARRVTGSLFHDPAHVTEERIAHALTLARQPHAARVMLETLRSLGGVRGVHPHWRAHLLDAVADLRLPVLVVWGDRDRILPAAHLAAARARLPGARTHLFGDCGHLPQVECAEEFSRLVTDFWTEPPDTRPTGPVEPPPSR